jgi:hypothetical protein
MSRFQSGATVARPIGFPIGLEEKPKPRQRRHNYIECIVGRAAVTGRIA